MNEWITTLTPLVVSLATLLVSWLGLKNKASEKEVRGMKEETEELRDLVKDLKKEIVILEKRLEACETAKHEWMEEKIILLERLAGKGRK